MGIKLQSLTVRKSFNFNTVEATVEIEGMKGDYEAASALLQHITNEELKKTLKEVNKLAGDVPAPAKSTSPQSSGGSSYGGSTGFPPRKLSEGQKKFAFVLQKQGKLPSDFDPDGANAYEQFRQAAGDSNDYKANNR